MKEILQVDQLTVDFNTRRGKLHAVQGLSFSLKPKEILCIVGESGCGKSVSALAIMGILPPNAEVKARSITLDGADLSSLSEEQRAWVRGVELAMIFQEARASLNPTMSIGRQITEVFTYRNLCSQSEALRRAEELLLDVGIENAAETLRMYPHQLSGGMCQRVMIAMALALKPKVLIADEATTALDVSIQAQILQLMLRLREEKSTGIIFITHDLAVAAEIADTVLVMYAGQAVELAPVHEFFNDPLHPYTQALLRTVPSVDSDSLSLEAIPGSVPLLYDLPKACRFADRCPYCIPLCRENEAELLTLGDRKIRCHLAGKLPEL